MHLIETGAIIAHGTLAEVFLPAPFLKVKDGRSRKTAKEKNNRWQVAMSLLECTITEAKHNSEEAQALFNLALFGRRDADSIQQLRKLFAGMEIPVEFLSH